MKKQVFITALILSFMPLQTMAEVAFDGFDDLEKIETQFYQSPTSIPVPEVQTEEELNKPERGLPVFKKTRIKITNYLREREYKKNQKLLEQEKKKLIEDDFEKNVSEIKESKENSDSDSLELVGGVKEQVTTKDVQLDADKIDFDEKTMDIIATGNPVLYFPPQKTTIKAEKMVYNNGSNQLKAYGKVEVNKDGKHIYGDYIQINMNEENAFMDNIKTDAAFMTVTSRKADMDDDKIVLYDGKMLSENSYMFNLKTKMIGGNRFGSMIIDEDDKSSIFNTTGDTAIHVKAKEIIVDAKRDHDVITIKKAQINYGDTKLYKIPSIKIHTNKNHNFFEANYPEIGSRSQIGMFAGPGFVFDTPLQGGSTLKLIPIINNKHKLGVGGFLKYRSGTNYSEIGYGSSNDVFVLRGRQELDDKLFLQYGSNSYLDEWFFGRRMPKYGVELIYDDTSVIPATLGENHDLRFRHRAGIGYMHNGDHNHNGEHIKSSNMGTTRFRYMGELNQTLFKYEDKPNRKLLSLGLIMQGSAAVYGTGDTQFVGRIGPALHTQYKNWMQDIGYFATGYEDKSPLPVYDCYRYGKGSVYVREALRLNKYLMIAWSGTMTLTDDAPNGKTFQENTFIVSLGPDDFKFQLGYDWVRKHTYFAFVIAMDTKGSSLEYEKMTIKNPDRLSRTEEEPVALKVFDNVDNTLQASAPQKKMMYAEVIDIEDPDREQIQ